MADLPHEIVKSRKGSIEAPAGCGKTHLLVQAALCAQGKQLILTHTHAGVRSILEKFRSLKATTSIHPRVTTIDGFSLTYSNAFSGLSGWTVKCPMRTDWSNLRPTTIKALESRAVRKVIQASYSGLLVDEYQDCTESQHQLIMRLAEILPCVVFGDPMQAIFDFAEQLPVWDTVIQYFPTIAKLDCPYRWKGKNEELGEWLLKQVRPSLFHGLPIPLASAPVSYYEEPSILGQRKTCLSLASESGSVIGVRSHRKGCYQLARGLKNAYVAMETIECENLINCAKLIDDHKGLDRVKIVFEFAKECLANFPSTVETVFKNILCGKSSRSQNKICTMIYAKLYLISTSDDLIHLAEVLDIISGLKGIVFARKELWNEFRRALRSHLIQKGDSLKNTAWKLRDDLRHSGVRVHRRCLSTPLLIKGLEFDHAIVLNESELSKAENLYVALTRGSMSLTILSNTGILLRNPNQQRKAKGPTLVQGQLFPK